MPELRVSPVYHDSFLVFFFQLFEGSNPLDIPDNGKFGVMPIPNFLAVLAILSIPILSAKL